MQALTLTAVRKDDKADLSLRSVYNYGNYGFTAIFNTSDKVNVTATIDKVCLFWGGVVGWRSGQRRVYLPRWVRGLLHFRAVAAWKQQWQQMRLWVVGVVLGDCSSRWIDPIKPPPR